MASGSSTAGSSPPSWTATAEQRCSIARTCSGWSRQQGAPLLYVTAGLDVRYLRPVPLGQMLELRAVVASADDDQVTVEAELVWDGKPRAAASALWKRWRPR